MTKIPRPKHPLDQMTGGELESFIEQLRAVLRADDVTEEDRQLVLGRLGAAYTKRLEFVNTGVLQPLPDSEADGYEIGIPKIQP